MAKTETSSDGDMAPADVSTSELILFVERALGEKLKWKDPPGLNRKDPPPLNGDTSGSHSESRSGENELVMRPWCFVLVQPGMAERWKTMCPKDPTRLWVLDPSNPGAVWYRVPVDRVESAIVWIRPLTPASYMVGLYFRRAARLLSCYLVGEPGYARNSRSPALALNPSSSTGWQEILCHPELQSPSPREHVFAHLLAVPGSSDFYIVEFGAVENMHTGAVTIRATTYFTSIKDWVRGPEMTTAGRRMELPAPSSAPAGSNVGQCISSCVKGKTVYIAIVTPPSGQQRGIVQVWAYCWEERVFTEHIGSMGWRDDPDVGKAVWETFQLLFDYDSQRLMIWAGWTEDELYTGQVDKKGKWKVSRFGRLKLDNITRKWALDRKEGGSKVRSATMYFSRPCYASGSGRDVEITSAGDGDYVISRKNNYGEIGFEDSMRCSQLPYPPDDYLAAQGEDKAAQCVCIGSFRPRLEFANGIPRVAAQTNFAPLSARTWVGDTEGVQSVPVTRTRSSPRLVDAQAQSVPPDDTIPYRTRRKRKAQRY